jgi:hypothetical protein
MIYGFVSPTSWRTWKTLCSVAACEPEQKAELYSVISANLRGALRQWQDGLPNYTDAELAQFFDEHFKLGYQGQDARNKDYLFLKFANITDEAEWAKRITGFIGKTASQPNSVAEPLVRHLKYFSPNVSPDDLAEAEIWVDSSLRPDVLAGKVDLKILTEKLTKKLAKGFFSELSVVHKAALWAIVKNKTPDDPEVLKLAGRKKASVYKARKELPDLLQAQLGRFYAAEDPEVIKIMALELAKAMLPIAENWEFSGNSGD